VKRPQGTLPSQAVTNPRNSSQAHMAQEATMNQCNEAHTLRSGKQVDNQVSMPPDPTPSSSTPSTSEYKSAEQGHKPTTPFLNRFRSNNNAQVDKILVIFNQVKINVPLLNAI